MNTHDSAGDGVNLPFVTVADLRDRAERASARLDELFRLSTLVHEMRTGTDHPVVAAALGMVSDSLSDLMPHAFAVADYAREAVLAGALTAVAPDGDEVNLRTLTVADLRARTVRANAGADAANRVTDLVTEVAEQCEDPVERHAWWQVWDRALVEAEGARLASRRAWDAYTAARDKESAALADSADADVDPPDAARFPGDEETPPSDT